MELVCFEICVYGPPPIFTKTNLRVLFWGFLSFMCLRGLEKFPLLTHHFAKMVKKLASTLQTTLKFSKFD